MKLISPIRISRGWGGQTVSGYPLGVRRCGGGPLLLAHGPGRQWSPLAHLLHSSYIDLITFSTVQAGFQLSAWKSDMDRQIFLLTWQTGGAQ